MKKGMSGHTLVIVITLIVALLGIVILTMFVFDTAKGGAELSQKISEAVCQMFKGASGMVGWFIDCEKVMSG